MRANIFALTSEALPSFTPSQTTLLCSEPKQATKVSDARGHGVPRSETQGKAERAYRSRSSRSPTFSGIRKPVMVQRQARANTVLG